MLPTKLQLEIATPDRLVLSESVDEVVLPSVEGSMGVLPGHAPLLARLDAGEVSYRIGNVRKYLAVSGGFAEVLRTRVDVLAETAERAEDIDVERARSSKQRAEDALRSTQDPQDLHEAEARRLRAEARLRVSVRKHG
jgi:F-type H+-transporting ATPase subunit epsilon